MYPGIDEAQLEWVCEAVHEYFRLDAKRTTELRLG
jgi:hypothetical protein